MDGSIMKIIELDQRYVLGKAGFTHAIYYRRRPNKFSTIERALTEMHGAGWHRWLPTPNLAWGYYISPKSGEFQIGVRNPADLTTALLMTPHV